MGDPNHLHTSAGSWMILISRPKGEVFVVTVRAERHDVPAIIRLRALLNAALRSFGLKCLSVKVADGD